MGGGRAAGAPPPRSANALIDFTDIFIDYCYEILDMCPLQKILKKHIVCLLRCPVTTNMNTPDVIFAQW